MSANASSIYTGIWVNWTRGRVLGSTVTLSRADGTVFVAFITLFYTVLSTQLWRSLCFLIHQARVSSRPRDGLFHQQQVVLRNSSTPAGAAWIFALQSWYWRGRADRHWLRSIPGLLLALVYIIIFAFLSIYGASVLLKAAGPLRLLRASRCGYWTPEDSDIATTPLFAKQRGTVEAARIYAQNCYEASDSPLLCNAYAKSRMNWSESGAECPFRKDLCLDDNVVRFRTDWLDSNQDFGINTPSGEAVQYRRTTTCAVVDYTSYKNLNRIDDGIIAYDFGPSSSNSTYTFFNTKSSSKSVPVYTVE